MVHRNVMIEATVIPPALSAAEGSQVAPPAASGRKETVANGGEGSAFSAQTLELLWPNRVHESNWIKNLSCYLGLHRWQDMQFGSSPSVQVARFCRWCSKIKAL